MKNGFTEGSKVGMRFGLASKAIVTWSKVPEPRKVSQTEFKLGELRRAAGVSQADRSVGSARFSQGENPPFHP